MDQGLPLVQCLTCLSPQSEERQHHMGQTSNRERASKSSAKRRQPQAHDLSSCWTATASNTCVVLDLCPEPRTQNEEHKYEPSRRLHDSGHLGCSCLGEKSSHLSCDFTTVVHLLSNVMLFLCRFHEIVNGKETCVYKNTKLCASRDESKKRPICLHKLWLLLALVL